MSANDGPIIICEPAKDCADANIHRWHCLRGHELAGKPALDGVCPLDYCDRQGANR